MRGGILWQGMTAALWLWKGRERGGGCASRRHPDTGQKNPPPGKPGEGLHRHHHRPERNAALLLAGGKGGYAPAVRLAIKSRISAS